MSIVLSESDYWLLTSLVFYPLSVNEILMPIKKFRMALNLPMTAAFDFSRDGSTQKLLHAGLIRATIATSNQDVVGLNIETTRESELFELTEMGGALWEKVSCVQWNRYVEDMAEVCNDEWTRVFTSIDEGRLMSSYSWAKEWRAEFMPVEGTEQCSRITFWEVTYWKRLSNAFRLTVLASEVRDWTRSGCYAPPPYDDNWYESPDRFPVSIASS